MGRVLNIDGKYNIGHVCRKGNKGAMMMEKKGETLSHCA